MRNFAFSTGHWPLKNKKSRPAQTNATPLNLFDALELKNLFL